MANVEIELSKLRAIIDGQSHIISYSSPIAILRGIRPPPPKPITKK
jgi:hypothetical protein